ncbi:MAG: triose-phosphate isomerase [Betaproteobacteria bacterium RIFCSPLOWO2_02_FULL_65_24]|nr:MAG: triose-phosphate isomerase [Betaproteobacteria bacterium RIFCSPLOWO2_02_FULL_65_24]OGA32282.1 MAG: triose-phosphate isomerase [Betaproteobacteria bacterium RIFCSPLOWO2_12_FULL_62_13b]
MRRKLVVGNWKMHGNLASNARLLDALKAALAAAPEAAYAVCVPYPYLPQAAERLHGSAIAWGAQDVSEHDAGAYTGEVSAPMLKDFGCLYAIVGHSERRALFGDTDRAVAAKFAAALRNDLTPIVCVGETLEQREQGEMEAVLARQVGAVLDAEGADAMARGVIAYEPVWAIGTGRTATPAQAQSAHEFVRGLVSARNDAVAARLCILYGGSMKPTNAEELFAMPDVDGGLIGGASLVADDFLTICRAAGKA